VGSPPPFSSLTRENVENLCLRQFMSCKTDLSLLRASSAGFTTGAPGSVSPLQPLTRSFTALNCTRRTNLLLTVLIKNGNLE